LRRGWAAERRAERIERTSTDDHGVAATSLLELALENGGREVREAAGRLLESIRPKSGKRIER